MKLVMIAGVAQGLGLGFPGLSYISDIFKEPYSLVVGSFDAPFSPNGINQRLTALAFAQTLPKDMRP